MIRVGGNLYTVYSRRKRVLYALFSLLMVAILWFCTFVPGSPGHIAATILFAIFAYSFILTALGHYPALRRVHPDAQRAIEGTDAPTSIVFRDHVSAGKDA